MSQYFTDSMAFTKPEPKHKLCESFYNGLISLQQRGRDNFAVRYGKQVDAELTYAQACKELGAAILHHLTCESRLDNRSRGER